MLSHEFEFDSSVWLEIFYLFIFYINYQVFRRILVHNNDHSLNFQVEFAQIHNELFVSIY